ncbi:hypothetical protein [Nostoc sp. 2RC]|uniref:hypothetical protein n=1 Tax=Nostoc sp. 2RC TaxID=2485484 RepID=UPI001624A1ED|nr:hypothetical protein [Nostoc sp. 2RC]MBC1241410.1 hypothetical protein [Nostoc sp. 2RC]
MSSPKNAIAINHRYHCHNDNFSFIYKLIVLLTKRFRIIYKLIVLLTKHFSFIDKLMLLVTIALN